MRQGSTSGEMYAVQAGQRTNIFKKGEGEKGVTLNLRTGRGETCGSDPIEEERGSRTLHLKTSGSGNDLKKKFLLLRKTKEPTSEGYQHRLLLEIGGRITLVPRSRTRSGNNVETLPSKRAKKVKFLPYTGRYVGKTFLESRLERLEEGDPAVVSKVGQRPKKKFWKHRSDLRSGLPKDKRRNE